MAVFVTEACEARKTLITAHLTWGWYRGYCGDTTGDCGKNCFTSTVLYPYAMTTHLCYVFKLFCGASVKYLQLVVPKYTTRCAGEHLWWCCM